MLIKDNVDRLYALQKRKDYEREQIIVEATPLSTSTDVVSPSAPGTAPYTFQRHIQTLPDYAPSSLPSSHHSPLTTLIQSAQSKPWEAPFSPADEEKPCPISTLPGEVFEHVFARLDVSSIEAFGSVSWRARYLTAHSERWRILAERIYVPPAILSPGVVLKDAVRAYDGEWRTMIVQKERIRMDGCYIAVCHYVWVYLFLAMWRGKNGLGLMTGGREQETSGWP